MKIYLDADQVNTFRYVMSKPELREDMLKYNTDDCGWRVESYLKGFDMGYTDELAESGPSGIAQYGKAHQAGYKAGKAEAKSLFLSKTNKDDKMSMNKKTFDARDEITKDNVDDWLISVKQFENVWLTRDIYYVNAIGGSDGWFQCGYFAINLSDTPMGNSFEEGYDLDIMDFKEYRLYHKDENGNYFLAQDTSL